VWNVHIDSPQSVDQLLEAPEVDDDNVIDRDCEGAIVRSASADRRPVAVLIRSAP
jgi:hypothetical protein